MNLTCHEFIVAAEKSHSPLILSEFVGSATVLKNGPIITNPYNIKQVAESIKIGLEMSEEEKLNRWQAMYNTVSKQDSLYWIKTCLVDIQNASEYNENIQSSDLETLTQDSFNEKFKALLSI
ncbi:unnamed protein product [Ambrosiozyma monospora]|uniref:Unnamed protein product n=1 Tax=Ambrosiozyma monospora TaxID=43982 RepID=A0ACB5UC79_AMBMO|nr:unnamed protein product [Ambrosiozyma monospora]